MFEDLHIDDIPRLAKFPFRVKSLGYTCNLPSHEMNITYRDTFEVCIRRFSRQPMVLEHINGKPYEVKFPNVILKYPGMTHRFVCQYTRDVVHFTYDHSLLDALKAVLPFPPAPIWEIELGEKENRLIAELMDLMNRSHEYGASDQIDLLAFQLLEILIFGYNCKKKKTDYYEARIKSIASYFQLHYRENIDIDKVCARYGMSRSTFLRHWRHFFDPTPGQYLQNLKLKGICQFLEENHSCTVNMLTTEFGFKEAAYLCSLFKKKYGMTPLQYRKSSPCGLHTLQ